MGIPGPPYSRDFRDPVVIIGTPSCRRLAVWNDTDGRLSLSAVYNDLRYHATVPRRSVNLLGCFQTKKLLPLLPKEVTSPWVLPKEVTTIPTPGDLIPQQIALYFPYVHIELVLFIKV